MIATAALRLQAGALYGFIERQKNLYKRYWAWEVVWFVYSLVGVLSIGYLASGLTSLGSGRVSFADALINAEARTHKLARVYTFDRRFPAEGLVTAQP